MTPADQQRLAEIRSICKDEGYEDGHIPFLLRLLDAATSPPPASAMEAAQVMVRAIRGREQPSDNWKLTYTEAGNMIIAALAAAKRRGHDAALDDAAQIALVHAVPPDYLDLGSLLRKDIADRILALKSTAKPMQRPGHYPQWVGTAAEVHPHPIGTADDPANTGE